MKKLIAISVMLVLLTGAAFAQISGDLFVNAALLAGNTEADDIMMGGKGSNDIYGAKWSLTFGEAPGTGRIVWRLHDASMWGWFAWRPIDMLRIKLGWDRDGEFGTAQINGWGFTAGAKDLVATNDYAGGLFMSSAGRGSPWYDGFGDGEGYSFIVSLYPMEGLQINVGIPQFANTAAEMSRKIANVQASIFYNIEDIGRLSLAFVGRGGLGKDQDKTMSVGDIKASFFLTALDSIRIDLGFSMGIPFTNASDKSEGGRMAIGLGFNMPTVVENVSFKLRGGAFVGGTNAAGAALNTVIMVGILPTYQIAPGFRFYFHAGMGMEMPETGDSNMGWFVNPYISYRAGGITFWAGLKVDAPNSIGTAQQKAINWSVPFGFSANY